MSHEEGRQRHRTTIERVEALERERRRDDEWQAHARQVILQHEARLDALGQNPGGATLIVDAIDRLTAATSRDDESTGHFSMHVTGIELKEEQMSPAVDTTPDLDLSASSVRAKISVVGPKATPTGPYLTSAEVTWSKSNESEPGAIELEAAPDDVQYELDGTTPILDAAGLQIPVYSVYANTPLEPAEGSRASGVVTVSGPGMANRTKKVTYGNAAVGHFTMEGVEAAEPAVP